jgi:membrane protein implicated in regulation of membrane protease activity
MKRLRWTLPKTSIPRHPFRDSAIFHGALSGIVIGVAALSGGDLVKAGVIAGAYFVFATAYSWWRWRDRLRHEQEKGELP